MEVRLFQPVEMQSRQQSKCVCDTDRDTIQTAVEVRFNATCIYYYFGNNNIVESSDGSATVPTSRSAIQRHLYLL
jgi:hypothetical protein